MHTLIITSILLTTVGASALSQPPRQIMDRMLDSSAAAIMRHVRAQPREVGLPQVVDDALRQRGRPQPISKLDELADSLVAMAVSTSSGLSPSELRATSGDIIVRLYHAGRPASAGVGQPYVGAFDRLVAIYRTSGDVATRMSVLSWIGCMPDHSRALGVLREAAMSNDFSATAAISALELDAIYGGDCRNPVSARQASEALLRELFERRLVQHPQARSWLEGLASRKGWTRRL